MSNQLQIFNNPEFGQVRVVEIDGKPYAVGVDVARALAYAKPSQAVIDHCKGIRKLRIPSHNQYGAEVIQETNVIPEGDVYRLIIKAADQSINPEIRERAEKFEKWIFDEVIPQIRKTGKYDVHSCRQKELIKILFDLNQNLEEYETQLIEAEKNTAEYRKAYRSWLGYRNTLKQVIKSTREVVQLRTKELALIEKGR